MVRRGEFGDERLGKRAAMLLAQKAARPTDSIPQGASDPAAAKGVYRFLENPRVRADLLWNPLHADAAEA